MFKSGFVAIIGRPNSGKSTLLNQLLGEKVSIVSDKPQTTRHKILGRGVKPDATCARFNVDVSGPTAAESVIKTVSDAINLSLRAAGAGLCHETVPTGITRAMYVEKCDSFAFAEPLAFNVKQLASYLL